ncbi:MAG: hypothetical protein WDN46_07760 [Methylocella sp.]
MSNPTERAKNGAVRFALSMGKRQHFASGGVVGPLHGVDGGRTDTLPISVPAGSYVIPADVVSGLPGAEGNSLAGHNALAKLFSSAPFSPDAAPFGVKSPDLAKGHTIPGQVHAERSLLRAKGGHVEVGGPPIDIMAAGGEHVVPPEVVLAIGQGNLKLGHEILDEFVKKVRKNNIKDLKKLPGPVKK